MKMRWLAAWRYKIHTHTNISKILRMLQLSENIILSEMLKQLFSEAPKHVPYMPIAMSADDNCDCDYLCTLQNMYSTSTTRSAQHLTISVGDVWANN